MRVNNHYKKLRKGNVFSPSKYCYKQFQLEFQPEAEKSLTNLQESEPKKYKKVLKTLGLMSTNLRHPSLKTHKYVSLSGPEGEDIFEAYVENKTPAAFRVFWSYRPGGGRITVLSISAHP